MAVPTRRHPVLDQLGETDVLLQLFDHAPVALQLYDVDGHSRAVNGAFLELFGSEPPPAYNVFQDEIAAHLGIAEQVRRAFAGEVVTLPPLWYDARDLEHVRVSGGRRAAIAATLAPVRDREGTVRHVLAMFRNATAEMLSRERQQQLAETNALVDRLRESEERFRTAQELSPNAFTIYESVSEDGRVVDFRWVYRNAAAIAVTPELGDVRGRRVLETLPQLRGSSMFDRSVRAAETGRPEAWDEHLGERSFHLEARRLGNGIAVSIEDITTRLRVDAERSALVAREQQARAAAEMQRRQLHELFMDAPAAIAILRGEELVFELANPLYCSLVGNHDLIGRRGREALPELVEQGVWDIFETVYASGESFVGSEFPTRIHRGAAGEVKDGYFNFTARATHGPDGRVDGVMIFAVDVTDLVRGRRAQEEAARALKTQQRWLEAVLDRMPTPLLLVEPGKGWVLFANRAADEIAGGTFPTTAEEYKDVEAFDADGVRLPPKMMPAMRAARGEKIERYEMGWKVHGRMRALVVDAALIPAMEGHPATVAVPFTDVTKLKEVEAQLKEAVRARDEFLSIASHELNTPLTPLRLQLDVLRRRGAEDGKLPERLATAMRQVDRLQRLVAQLLDVSRLANGRLQLEPEEVDLAKIATDVCHGFFGQNPERLRLDARSVVGWWDPMRLEQIVTNLVSNAVKYGEGRPVDVRVDQVGDRALVEVRDHGIGIDPAQQQRIFERFERAVSSRHFGGFGLGLWIVRQIVEALGGTIRVASAPGEGATFTVELPLAAPEKVAVRRGA